MQTHISLKIKEDIAYLTFACDQPDKPPTLDLAVLGELETHLAEIEANHASLRVLILQSAAEKYFVVGANLNALQTLNPETIIPWVQKGHAVFNRLENLPLPVIARVTGYALGGGLELAMACDLILATEGAKFGQPEAGLGVVPGWGGSFRLPRRIGPARAKELFFSGKIIDAATAYTFGLVNFAGPAEALDLYLAELLAGIRQNSPLAVSSVKELVNGSADHTLAENCLAEAVASSLCLASEDTQNRVASYLEKRRKK